MKVLKNHASPRPWNTSGARNGQVRIVKRRPLPVKDSQG